MQVPNIALVNLTPQPIEYGDSVNIRAVFLIATPAVARPQNQTVPNPNASGTMTFVINSTLSESFSFSTVDGSATPMFALTNLPVGADTISATFTADSTSAAASDFSSSLTVNVAPASTITSLVVTPAPTARGSYPYATLTATVSAANTSLGQPTGTVQFFSGSTSLGTGTLSNGVATLSTQLPIGYDDLRAVYQSTGNFATSEKSVSNVAGSTTEILINTVYQNVLERNVDPAGLRFWDRAFARHRINTPKFIKAITHSREARQIAASHMTPSHR